MLKIAKISLVVAALSAMSLTACKEEPPPPPPDKDGDGMIDSTDKCPDKAETKNGFEDNDGCPDEAPPPKPVIPAYEPTGDMADLKKAAAAGIDENNAMAKATELETAIDAATKDMEAKKAAAPKKK
jgi:hypothetical protein